MLVDLLLVLVSRLVYLGMSSLLDETNFPELRWAVSAFCLALLLIGFSLVARSLLGLLHDWRMRKKTAHDTDPWLRDHPWNKSE